ncbi:MAG: hypothetical protein ACFE8B_01835 [Candidatus Hermodarchaeota archaeon]
MNKKNRDKNLLFFNEAIEYFDKFTTQDILSSDSNGEGNYNANFLRDAMINELENLKSIIESNPDFKLETLKPEERQQFKKFINYYSICPVCRGFNHYFNLKQLFFDDNKKNLIADLVKIMNLKNKKLKSFNINFGIPCCECYKKLTEK